MANTINIEQLAVQREYTDKVAEIFNQKQESPMAYIHSFGCQQNVSDGEKIKGTLAMMGYGFTDNSDFADLVLFNTCAVRENAEERVFGNIGALKHKKRRNPNMIVGICGCMVQQEHITQRIIKSFPFVDMIFGTHSIHTLPQIVYETLTTRKRNVSIPQIDGFVIEGMPLQRESTFKASVPIVYGCNNFCTFCIVPHVRGRERSRKQEDIVAEVRELINSGYKDITLLGQNVNSYGKDLGLNFSGLLQELDQLEGEFKISFMTSHPKDATRELIDVIAESKHISRHLHLPIQSGSNRILKKMNRRYTVEKYIDLVEYAKKRIPDINLTSDIIVGFPGETYEDFRETLDLIEKVRYDSLFTFIYSKRKGTPAAEMDDPISREEKGVWFHELCAAQQRIGGESYYSFVGKNMTILCEGIGRTDDGMMTGKTIQNIIVDFNGDTSLIGSFVNVKITKALSWALIGEII